MHIVVEKAQLSPNVTRLVIEAPRIAEIRRPGQFVIVRLDEGAERIPLTIADADAEAGGVIEQVQHGDFGRDLFVGELQLRDVAANRRGQLDPLLA